MTGVQTCALPICFPVTIGWRGGDLTFEIEPGCVYAYGQKDNRGGNTQVNYIAVDSEGNVTQLKNSAEARKILLAKEGA